MENYIAELGEGAAAEELWRAIKGKGAFGRFKETAGRLGLRDAWHAYREHAMKEFVRDWAEARQIPMVDDTAPRPES